MTSPSSAPARRPVVGITAAREPIRHGAAWHQPADFSPGTYADAVVRAGGRPVLLPAACDEALSAAYLEELAAAEAAAPGEAVPHGPAARALLAWCAGLAPETLEHLDGLLLTGGVDVSPASYGQPRDPATAGDTPVRDMVEMTLGAEAVRTGLPVLGICRGMQILGATFGGALEQHLPDRLGTDEHRRVPGTLDERNAHDVELAPGSLAATAAGGEVVSVRSHHHQAVVAAPDGWIHTGLAEDGLLEAMERPGEAYALAVQWHPEAQPESPVIASLVAAAARRSSPASVGA